MSELALFTYEGCQTRTVTVDGEPAFVGKDICDVVGISKYRDASRKSSGWPPVERHCVLSPGVRAAVLARDHRHVAGYVEFFGGCVVLRLPAGVTAERVARRRADLPGPYLLADRGVPRWCWRTIGAVGAGRRALEGIVPARDPARLPAGRVWRASMQRREVA